MRNVSATRRRFRLPSSFRLGLREYGQTETCQKVSDVQFGPVKRCNQLVIMDVKKEFGMIVRDRRTRLGLSQSALALRADLPRTYVTDIERGMRNLTLQNISKLADAFGLPIGHLFRPLEDEDSFNGNGTRPFGQSNLVDILIVESNPRDIELSLNAFKQAKMTNRVHVERDGEAALNFIFFQAPDQPRPLERMPGAVLLGLNLPKIDGLQVLRRIKENPRTCNLKVVVLSSGGSDEKVAEAMRLGAAGFIAKPVSFQNFCQITPKLEFSWTLLNPNLISKTRGTPGAARI